MDAEGASTREGRFAPRTVVFLGAGASWCSGYPVAKDLLPAIEKEAESTRSVNLRSLWRPWKDFRDKVANKLREQDPLARLILSPNPEVALSAIDLMEAALSVEDDAARRRGFAKAGEDMYAGARLLEGYYQGEARELLSEPRDARNSLIQAMEWYFFQKHAGLHHEPKASRDYLRDLLCQVGFGPGDAIITTNWDAVAELTLGEEGLWSPFDGYGFLRQLASGYSKPDGTPASFPAGMPERSQVKVLKLHGSFGWKYVNARVHIDYDEFLYHLPFQYESEMVTFRDRTVEELPGQNPPVLLYPSFLKRIVTPELHEVWHMASEAVRSCERFVAAGYSLPEADAAVRVMLLPVRFRAMAGQLKVEVFDPSDETLDRWREFLEGNILDHRLSLCTSLRSARRCSNRVHPDRDGAMSNNEMDYSDRST